MQLTGQPWNLIFVPLSCSPYSASYSVW